jgi:cytochrome c oxidase cbb3-type subunit 1
MMTMGSLYCLTPRLVGKKQMYSVPAIDAHFWLSTIGVVLYIASMWIAGVMQGLMWRAFNDDGTLTYTFIETIAATKPYYAIRLLGGTLFFAGTLIMAWNMWKTMAGTKPQEVAAAEPKNWDAHEGSRA